MKIAYIIQGISAGDENKGSLTDLLTHKTGIKTVIRHSGGPQCGHNVVVNVDGKDEAGNIQKVEKHHCFQSWGSGSFCGAKTTLLKNVLVNPLTMEAERKVLAKTLGIGNPDLMEIRDPLIQKMHIHEDCLIITPYHIALNRVQESINRHGSVGSGCWATIEFAEKYPELALRARDLKNIDRFNEIERLFGNIPQKIQDEIDNLCEIHNTNFWNTKDEYVNFLKFGPWDGFRRFCRDFADKYQIYSDEEIKEIVQSDPVGIIFEGNQGTLLDPDFGFHPHVTANSSTCKHAEEFLEEIGWENQGNKKFIIGVTRPYMTRHGAGPFYEDYSFEKLEGERNQAHPWQGEFKYGIFNIDALNYSLSCQPVDYIFVSCLDNDPFDEFIHNFTMSDKKDAENSWNSYFWRFSEDRGTIKKATLIAEMLNTPLCGFSFSPNRDDKFIQISLFQ